MRVIVEEAHHQKLKAAAHATTPERIKNALMAGVDSIEHGHQANRENLEMMKAKGTFLVPTVGVIDAIFERTKNDPMTPKRRERRETFLQGIQQEVQQAMSLGVKIASGFDAGAPARQGRNADSGSDSRRNRQRRGIVELARSRWRHRRLLSRAIRSPTSPCFSR